MSELIFITGEIATGKTIIAQAFAKRFRDDGKRVLIFDEMLVTSAFVQSLETARVNNDIVIVLFQTPTAKKVGKRAAAILAKLPTPDRLIVLPPRKEAAAS